jgi:alkanesulfonate monooxygenase SsuD/methylene tetrahydromethanopterin reductase-like flavin-dependent oxidoreductase (luciferase family)
VWLCARPQAAASGIEKCRKSEDLGYDTIAVIDHLGMPAPFPALMLAAEVTERARLGAPAIMDQRVDYARAALGDRISEVELNVVAPAVAVTTERHATLEMLQHLAPSLSIEERETVPGLLVGTAQQIADKIQNNRERYGFSYVTVLEHSLEAMAPIIKLLR